MGLSYWFEQQSPLAPYYFSITNRDISGSSFTFLQTPGLTYPQALAPANPSDLGGSTQSGAGVGAGNYLVSNITVSIDPSTPAGTYIIENTTSPAAKRSVISDDHGHTFGIPQTTYTITVVTFQMTSIARQSNGDVLLHGQGVPNSLNRIEASPDLSPNSFQTIGSVTPDMSGIVSYTDSNPGLSQRFYRLAFP